ncbi:MAG TPA: hypothetical protein VGO47_04115 [Chlamydiales bacterium]|nr:hypothetical protein [Chlamydiales bacterium]
MQTDSANTNKEVSAHGFLLPRAHNTTTEEEATMHNFRELADTAAFFDHSNQPGPSSIQPTQLRPRAFEGSSQSKAENGIYPPIGLTASPSMNPLQKEQVDKRKNRVNERMNRAPAYQVLQEWRYVKERVRQGKDMHLACAGQNFISPKIFQEISEDIKKLPGHCTKCADFCTISYSEWRRHLAGPHQMDPPESADQLVGPLREIRKTYCSLKRFARIKRIRNSLKSERNT